MKEIDKETYKNEELELERYEDLLEYETEFAKALSEKNKVNSKGEVIK